jgi:erythromycin esterase
MGSYLASVHGSDYMAIGQFFHEGRHNAVAGNTPKTNDAVPSFPGSAEYIFHSTGMPLFFLDMRNSWNEDPEPGWMRDEIELRNIGAGVADGFWITARLARDYDALVFFDRTTPSVLLPF